MDKNFDPAELWALAKHNPLAVTALFAFAKRAANPLMPTQARPAPHQRTEIAETTRVVVAGWNDQRCVNRWAYERNIFWLLTASFS